MIEDVDRHGMLVQLTPEPQWRVVVAIRKNRITAGGCAERNGHVSFFAKSQAALHAVYYYHCSKTRFSPNKAINLPLLVDPDLETCSFSRRVASELSTIPFSLTSNHHLLAVHTQPRFSDVI